MSDGKTKVLLVDDHRMVLDSLSMLLAKYGDYQVVATFTNGHDVIPYIRKHKVDLIITDSRMPQMSGIQLCEKIFAFDAQMKVIMISMIEDPSEILGALDLGVKAYLSKSLSVEQLLSAIKEVLEGKRYLSNEVILALNTPIIHNHKLVNGFTLREVEIIQLIAQELSTSEIAERLFISVHTVDTHRKNLYQKAGVKSAVGLALYALKNRLIS